MDKVTQQNAAVAEESTAASQTMAQEVSQLSQLIGQFQVGQANGKVQSMPRRQPVAPAHKAHTRPSSGPRKLSNGANGLAAAAVAMKAQIEDPAADWQDF
jgi:methyl-accepting chemotaxis protein